MVKIKVMPAMRYSLLLSHAAEVVAEAFGSTTPADSIIDKYFRARRYLGSKDRKALGDLVFSVLRNGIAIDCLIDELIADKEVLTPFVKGLLRVLLHETLQQHDVDLMGNALAEIQTKQMPLGSFDCFGVLEHARNALLQRKMNVSQEHDPVTCISKSLSLPVVLAEALFKSYGEQEAKDIATALLLPAPLAIRVNVLKTNVATCRRILAAEGYDTEPCTYALQGLRVARRLPLRTLSSYAQGLYEVQDEGSQLLGELVAVEPGMHVIDACAGAGGKTLQLAALMANSGRIDALDVINSRLDKLKARAQRAGATNITTNLWTSTIEGTIAASADRVLVDAPCSGTGTYRRSPWLKLTFNANQLDHLVDAQKKIIRRSASFVKPGGRIIYCTCSLLPQENEGIVEDFIEQHPNFHVLPWASALKDLNDSLLAMPSSPYAYFLPHRLGCDGFFAAVLERKA